MSLAIGGELRVHRLGYGAMQLTGAGAWGPPRDREAAIRVLRRAVELGVNFIDTADSYGPHVSEELISEALRPYPEGLVIATKAGLVRTGPDEWHSLARPPYLRQQVELSLRRLGVERIDLFQLHRIDPTVPLADQLGVLAELRKEGKLGHVGLSQVTVDELVAARRHLPIASVQNLYHVANRQSESVLDYCQAEGICFIPWYPLANGELARAGGPLDALAASIGATPAQVALAWLLHRSPITLPIPGTTSPARLAENVAAARITLTGEQVDAVARAATAVPARR